MPGTFSYNATDYDSRQVIRATSGGTVFTDVTGQTSFDYFDDSAVVDDAIYFGGWSTSNSTTFSDVKLNIGTALVASDVEIVWEYWEARTTAGDYGVWNPINNILDNTNNFQNTGELVVEFPVQPYMSQISVGGTTKRCWVRARINSVTGITEGGANITSVPKVRDGIIRSVGWSEGDYFGADELYTWMAANTRVPVKRFGISESEATTYFFPTPFYLAYMSDISLNLFFGNGAGYLESRIYDSVFGKERGSGGVCGCNIFIHNTTGGNTLALNRTQLYGCSVSSFVYYDEDNDYSIPRSSVVSRLSGQDITAKGSTFSDLGYINENTTLINSIMLNRNGFVNLYNLTDNGKRNGLKIFSDGYIFNCYYDVEQYWREVSFAFNEAAYEAICSSGTLYGNFKLHLIDCDLVLPNPDGSGDYQVFITYIDRAYLQNLDKLLIYDSSADTYTDYLTEASSDAGVVPLYGDVGDVIYAGWKATDTNVGYDHYTLIVDHPEQDSGYEYEWSYYHDGAWNSFDNVIDVTQGFSAGGVKRIFLTFDSRISTQDLSTINGVSSRWIRGVITKKGSGSPVANKITTSMSRNVNNWHVYEDWTFNLKLIDYEGNAIEGASVRITDGIGETQVNETTLSDGTITEQVFNSKDVFFDPISNPDESTYQNWQIDKSEATLTISKPGYQTYTSKLDMSSKKDLVIKLEKAVDIVMIDDDLALNTNPKNPRSDFFSKI